MLVCISTNAIAMDRTFRTHKGVILGLIIWGSVLAAFYRVGLPGILNREPVHLITQSFIFLLVGTIWFGIRYRISNGKLKINLGPFTPWEVDIKNIKTISRSYNPLSSPAPSLRRINLKLRDGGFLLLSPRNEQLFIRTLTDLNPAISNNVPNDSSDSLTKFFHWLL